MLSVSNLYLALDEIYHLLRSKPEERDSLKAHRTRRTASDERDSHPRWCSFPRGLHLRLRWLRFSRLQFKAEGPNFNAELIPVHSPLLRESCLVSYPPLTYMLKFSGFADLTSCLGCRAHKGPKRFQRATRTRHAQLTAHQKVFRKLLAEECPNTTDIRRLAARGSRHPNAQIRTQLTQLGPPHSW